MKISYPKILPISERIDELKSYLSDKQVLIVCGATGSGKTTQLPKVLLEMGYGVKGLIGSTQPRRLAAVGMARRLAEELECELGGEVAFQVRFDKKISDKSVIKFMTDGVLLAETRHDPQLKKYDALIIDEAHERGLNIDFLLGYLRNLLTTRPDLRLIISSATLNAEAFSEFFHDAPIIKIEGRTYPVEDYFLEPKEGEDLSSHVARAAEWLNELDMRGDILVFLPGEREIRDCADLLRGRRWPETEVLPLYGRLSLKDQQKVFKIGGRRRIVLATNVAETSLTIPGIRFVIDSGLVRINRYNPRFQIQSLQVETVSQASASQRRGRCGRVSDGLCVHLYSEIELNDSPSHTDPEIRRCSLAGVILRMKILRLAPIEKFPFIDPPKIGLVNEGYRTLFEISALDREKRVTKIGREIAEFPIDPHLARIIIQGRREGVLWETIVITSYLSIPDPRERPSDNAKSADEAHDQWRDSESDFIGVLRLWNWLEREYKEKSSSGKIRRLCSRNFLNFRRMKEWRDLVNELGDLVKSLKWDTKIDRGPFKRFSYAQIHKSLLAGLPMNIGEKDREQKFYRGSRGKEFHIFPGSGLFHEPPEWLMTFALVETTRLYARIVGEINPVWLESTAPHLCRKSYRDIHWNRSKGFIYATETVGLGGLSIIDGRKRHYGKINQRASREIFLKDGLSHGEIDSQLEWLAEHAELLSLVNYLEGKIRRPDALMDWNAIYEYFDQILPKWLNSTKDLEKWSLKKNFKYTLQIEDVLLDQLNPIKWNNFPDQISFYARDFELSYKFDPCEADDGVCLLCPSSQMTSLPYWALDWLIPAWLPEKVRLLIRSLPKSQRVECNPLNQTVDSFIASLDENPESRQGPLLNALTSFLREKFNLKLHNDDFELDRLPGHLIMKLAETDDNGNIIRIHQEMPDLTGQSTRVGAFTSDTERWTCSGLRHWPFEDEMPMEIEVDKSSGAVLYPALVDEESGIGAALYSDSEEAAISHKKGLSRLFRLRQTELIKYSRKSSPLSSGTKMTLSIFDPKHNYLDDLLNSAIQSVLTNEGSTEIRSAAKFAKQEDCAKTEFYQCFAELGGCLNVLVESYDDIRRIQSGMSKKKAFQDGFEDIESQLNFLFRPGFLTDDMVWERYAAYLRAIKIRLERLQHSPAKDNAKMKDITPYQIGLDELLEVVSDFSVDPSLRNFAWLLQEYRIAIFAPEVRPKSKVSASRVRAAWDEL